MKKSQNGIFPELVQDELSGPPQEPLAMSDTTNPMMRIRSLLPGSRIGIIGGKRLCRSFLEILFRLSLDSICLKIVGVADPDDDGEGIRFAKEKNILKQANDSELIPPIRLSKQRGPPRNEAYIWVRRNDEGGSATQQIDFLRSHQ